ncbi:MAG: T9SS type A sorting domain-containing protein, partial [Flavobacteriales bacterium]|nr:T9SS type A sorting domain-containing protein [Flavobacteriales bacterium]
LLRKVGDQWVELGAGLQGDCYVSDLEVYNDLLWVTGYFFASAGNAATGIMAWDGTQWIDPFPQVELTNWGRSMQVANGKLYFVGPMSVPGLPGTYRIGEFDGNNLCILGGNQVWTARVVASPDTLYANACAQVGCDELGGAVVNGIMKMPLDYPPDTCYSITQGLAERGTVGLVELYPNPASGTLNIAGLGLENARIDLTLLDALGQLVLSSNMRCAGGNAVLDLPPLAPGAYHVQLRDKLGTLVRSATIILEP